MRKMLLLSFVVAMPTVLLQAGDGICPRCEAIREYNVEHHKNYEYFEDYEKEDPETGSQNKKNVEKPLDTSAKATNAAKKTN